MTVSWTPCDEDEAVDPIWGWQPLGPAWFDRVRSSLRSFDFDPRLGVEGEGLRSILDGAAEARAAWLIHPSASLLTDPRREVGPTIGRHLLLAAWAAANGETDVGRVEVRDELLLWTPGGARLVPPGRYDLRELGAELTADPGLGSIGLDPCGATLDGLLEDTWVNSPDPDHGADSDQQSVCTFLGAIGFVDRCLPAISGWARRVTKVVVPFRSAAPTDGFRSSSSPEIPGMVRMDISFGSLRILECLAHETAHRYFYHCEADEPFVLARFADRLFPSPLKPRPRPLRSVMLAYHALAYILACFTDLAEAGVVGDREAFEVELDGLRQSTIQARETCDAARAFLTEGGLSFLEQTGKVAGYGLAW